ncbi:unnamed protein product [Prunus armeniaca]|uniref:Uncharacterized protein n=1 Tax=Prunus armeniaca TaxID=36596 RepID=A0A6J5WI78_PRUAR|nr:unnamed protein product [Prunus armeniaca]
MITIGGIYFMFKQINWRMIFVISCVISVIVDPLFLYIPIINQDIKCIDMDKALYKTAFALRAVADFSYFVDLLGWRFLNIAMLINSLVMVQYVPRILRIYFACKELKESFNERIGLWIKSVLNFLLYILASHIQLPKYIDNSF